MPLALATLKSGLLDLFSNLPTAYDEAAQRFVQAYQDYAATATSHAQGAPLAFAPGLAVAALTATFAGSRLPPTTAAGIATALTAFWMVPPVVFSFAPPAAGPGTVILAPGGPALTAALVALPPAPSADLAATSFAAALDAFTRLVVVLHPMIPPAPPLALPLL